MCSIVDVADYILEKYGTMTTMKLQKLAFYSQARALVVNGMPLFDEDFEAWANGPVSPALYALHKGRFLVHPGESRMCWWKGRPAWARHRGGCRRRLRIPVHPFRKPAFPDDPRRGPMDTREEGLLRRRPMQDRHRERVYERLLFPASRLVYPGRTIGSLSNAH